MEKEVREILLVVKGLEKNVGELKDDVIGIKDDVVGIIGNIQELKEGQKELRSVVLEEIAILERKFEEHAKAIQKEVKSITIDVGYLVQKTGRHDADIHKLTKLVQS